MSKKSQLKKAIKECELEIKAYESKRERSQTEVVRALLAGKKPAKRDEKYFNTFTDLIDQARERLRQLNAELKALDSKD